MYDMLASVEVQWNSLCCFGLSSDGPIIATRSFAPQEEP